MQVVSDSNGGVSSPGLAEVEAFDTAMPPRSSVPDLAAASDTNQNGAVPTTIILRPDEDVSVSGVTYSSGSTAWDLIDEAVLDTADYVKLNNNGYAFVGFTATGLDPGQAIGQVTFRANVTNAASAWASALTIRRPSDGEQDQVIAVPQGTYPDQSVSFTTRTWDGLPWTVADLDGLQFGAVGPGTLANLRLRQVWVEVTYTTRDPVGHASDGRTSDATPTFEGTVEAGADHVDLYDDTVLLGTDTTVSGGTWQVTSSALDDGYHAIWAKVTDGGSQTSETGATAVTVDTVLPAALAAGSDTAALVPTAEVATVRPDADIGLTGNASLSAGSTAWNLIDEAMIRTSDHVFVANGSVTVSFPDSGLTTADVIDAVTVKASVRNPASAEAGALFVTDPATTTRYTIGSIPQNATASQSITLTTRPWDSLPWTLADVDALQVGASCACPSAQKFRLDQLWVEVSYTALRAGAYGGDGITSDTTPAIAGNSPVAADHVEVREGASVLATDTSVSGGTWEVTLPTLSGGSHDIDVDAYDTGDVLIGSSVTVTVVIDTTAPTAPSVPDLAPGSDTGVADDDDITDDVTPSFSGTVPAGAIQVELHADGLRVGTDTTIVGGTWDIATAALPPGDYGMTARATDAAGNTGISDPLDLAIVAELVQFVAYTTPTGDVGSAGLVSVVVQDETSEPLDTWTGTILVASSDPADTFPDGDTFAMASPDDGTGHTFRVLFGDAGSRTLTASATGVVPGTTDPVVVGDVDLVLTAPEEVSAGQPFALRVSPRRADGQVARQYVGEVALASSDGAADFGPEVDGQDEYRYECACGDGHTFTTRLTATGTQTVTVEDGYGNTDTVEIEVSTAPSTGNDPIVTVRAVRWDFGSIVDYYLEASEPLTVLAVEDIAVSAGVLARHSVDLSFGAGFNEFSAASRRDGHILASNWYQPWGHRIWYTNASGRIWSRDVTRVKRFDLVPDAAEYREQDPGDPILAWTVSHRDDTATTIAFEVGEPTLITTVAYSFQGTGWDELDADYVLTPGTPEVKLGNDPVTCYFGYWYENNYILIEYEGLATGRQGRIISPIPHGTQRYSGPCGTMPPETLGEQAWLQLDLFRILTFGIEGAISIVGDPVDVADGYATGPVTDLAIGGLEPALAFSRTYDGRTAEDAVGQVSPDTLLGPGWTSSLDWRIETFGTDPEGVIIRGGDGGRLAFLRNSDDSYTAIDGSPFTFEGIVDGYELRRLDRSGYRFDDTGRLEAVLHRSGREMTLAYDVSAHLDSFTDAAGRTADVTTDGDGLVTRIDLPGGRHVDYGYDADGRLVEVTDLAGSTISYEVDRRNRITAIRDDLDRVVLRNVHDGQGRVVLQTDGEGNATHLTFDPDNGITQVLDPRGGLTTYQMDQVGHVVATCDAEGAVTLTDHDSYGHIRSVTDPLGATTVMVNDPQGRPLSRTDPLGRTVETTYDGDGDPVELADAEGRTVTVDYDLDKLPETLTITDGVSSRQLAAHAWTAQELLETMAEPGGATTTFAYDADGFLESATDAEGRVTTYEVDDRGFVTTIVDPAGNVLSADPADHDWLHGYDDLGRLLSTEDPTAATTTYTYDDMGRVATMTDAAGIETTYTYDVAGRLVSESIAIDGDDPAVTRYEYDDAGNRTAVIDAEDRRTEFEYDLVGRVVLMRDADDQEWTTAYDAKGRVIARTDPTERTTTYEYDLADRLVGVTDAGGHETSYTYDDADRLLTVTDELAGETAYEYDWLGRRISETNAEEDVTEYDYDAADDLVSMTDALLRETVFEYDATHRLTLVVDALLGETEYVYDERGLLAIRTDARGHTESYGYDAAGRPTLVTDPLTNDWQTVYDASGRVDHTVDANGDQTDYAYDELGRVETITPETGPAITFVHDLTGRRLSMADGAGTTVYGYDPVGRLIETLRGGRTTSYAYDPAGRLTEVEYPGSLGTVALDHDAEGRLGTITDWDSRETTLGYDALDRVTSIERPGDLLSTYGYDALGRVTSIEHAYASSPVMTLAYGYDAVGNVISRTDDQGTATFDHDVLDRLTDADYVGADDYGYGYDAVGNLTSITTPGGTTTHTYDDADRIDDAGYSYDDNGALLTDGTRTFTYDALGRLTGVSGGGHTAAYVLDGDGNRTGQTVDSVTTDLDLDLRGMPTVLADGARAYLPGMSSLGYSDGSDWTSALTDAQGSVLRHIDDTGTMTALTRYDPYGGARPSTTLPDGFGFAGEWADPTGLVNLRARAYDPSLGAFLSRDSFPGIGTMPLTGNRHAYASGNPMRYTDPTGHFISAGQAFLSGAWLSQDPVELIVTAIEDGPGLGGMVEGGLDAAGFVPGVGDAVDLGRAAFDFTRYLVTGDQDALVQATVGAVSAVPIIGSLGRHADDVLDVAGVGARRGDEVLVATRGGMAGVRAAGRSGEAAAGIVKNTTRIPSASGRAAYRIPDELDASVLGEVKNVKSLGWSSQISDMYSYATANGLEFKLYVRPSTVFRGQLAEFSKNGRITRVEVPGMGP